MLQKALPHFQLGLFQRFKDMIDAIQKDLPLGIEYNAVVGAVVQMCSNTYGCIPFEHATDENGVTKNNYYKPSNDYQAKVISLPNGYTVIGDESLSSYYDFDSDNIVIIKVTKTAE